jgi:uncharacterized BrkB/YihY/UPF0761 family membrane protein
MELTVIAPYVSLVVGIVARVFVPWLAKRRENPEEAKWTWRFVWPQLVSVALIFLLLPLIISDLSAIGKIPWQAAWLAGWGAADLGRKTYKVIAKEEG